MNLLFIGDIVGKGGRKAVKALVPELRRKYNCAFVVANAENVAGGSGLNAKCLEDLLPGTLDAVTAGDHVWAQKSYEHEILQFKAALRPSNVNPCQPGRGHDVFNIPAGGRIAVINLVGRVFMKEAACCPFAEAERILKALPSDVNCVLVDFHAEATSEKLAMGRFLDGKVTAVVGTHTHVQTADAKVLPGGTAYISDVGMAGGADSILGREPADVLRKFTTGMPIRLNVVESGAMRVDAVVVSFDRATGRATAIEPLSITVPGPAGA